MQMHDGSAMACGNSASGWNQVVPGARVPADGVIVDGRSHVDESMVTGESIPATKRPGDAVIGGTVNCGAPLVVKVCPRPSTLSSSNSVGHSPICAWSEGRKLT